MSLDDNMRKYYCLQNKARKVQLYTSSSPCVKNGTDAINYTHVQTGMPLILSICLPTLGTFKHSLYIKFLCELLLNAWYIHIYQKLKTYVTWSAQRIKMNCKKILFLKCLRQFVHFFIQFTKTDWASTAKRNVILKACFYKTYFLDPSLSVSHAFLLQKAIMFDLSKQRVNKPIKNV